MPRVPRIESSEGLYHVINRGNYRSWIFETEGAKNSFERTLFEACQRSGWRLHAYCILSNHYHLCLSTPHGNLSEGMRWLQATFASRFNRFRKEKGHLFQGRFKSLVVEPGTHYRDLVDYIHLNPVRAGNVEAKLLAKYPWTSLYYFPKKKIRPAFLDPGWTDGSDAVSDSPSGWRRYLQELQLRDTADPSEAKELDRKMCRGWCLGSRSFKEALVKDLRQNEQAVRLEGDALGDFNLTIWERSLRRCMVALGKKASDASADPKYAGWKLAIASKLKRETSATNAWLCAKLEMGTPNGVSAMCGRYSQSAMATCEYASKLTKLKVEQ